MSFAEITAIGNVGKAPEVRYSPEGKEFCHFSVAVNENTGKKDKQGNSIKEVTWFNVTCTGNLVNVVTNFVKKGDSVFVRGKLKARKYSSSSGMEVSLDLFATTIHLMPNNRASNEQESNFEQESDNTDFNHEEYEQELASSQAAKSNTPSSPSSPSSPNNKSRAAPGAIRTE